jgi:hypothetical protein
MFWHRDAQGRLRGASEPSAPTADRPAHWGFGAFRDRYDTIA